jgi:hypothetical protein
LNRERGKKETDSRGCPFHCAKNGSKLSGLFKNDRQHDLASAHHLVSNDEFLDLLVAGHVVHNVEHQFFEDHTQATRANFALQRLARNLAGRLIGPGDFYAFEIEQARILLQDRVTRASKNIDQRSFVQFVENAEYGQASNKLGDQTVLEKILRFSLAKK